jgi:hypothetical protein
MDDRNSETMLVDRMVDGELDEGAEKELLARLDSEPEGWRRLALAFVESRVWSRELPAAMKAPAAPADPERVSSATSERSTCSDFGWQLLTIASTLLLSFGLGLWVRGFWTPGIGGDGGPGHMGLGPPPFVSTNSQASVEPSKMLIPVPQERQVLEVPVFSASDFDPSWIAETQPIVPRHVLKALERSGHRIEQRREFMPFQLQDGRQVIVPVDQVELHYVGRPVQ